MLSDLPGQPGEGGPSWVRVRFARHPWSSAWSKDGPKTYHGALVEEERQRPSWALMQAKRAPGRLDSGVEFGKIDKVRKRADGSELQGLQGSQPSRRGCALAGEAKPIPAVAEL